MSNAMAVIRYKYLIRDVDRHGNERWYVRAPGRRKVRIKEAPCSAAFEAAYRQAIEAAPAPSRSSRIASNTLQALEYSAGIGQ